MGLTEELALSISVIFDFHLAGSWLETKGWSVLSILSVKCSNNENSRGYFQPDDCLSENHMNIYSSEFNNPFPYIVMSHWILTEIRPLDFL